MVRFSEQIDQVVAAHSSFLAAIRDVGKDQKGYGYKYADLAQLLAMCLPVLADNGLSLTQFPSFLLHKKDAFVDLAADSKGFVPQLIGEVIVVSTLAHSSGQYLSGELQIPVETMKNLSVAQAVGAAISYGRRYHASAILGIAQEDNDAARPQTADSGPSGGRSRGPAIPQRSAPNAALLGQPDVARLRRAIQALGRDEARFANAVAGVDTLERIPASSLPVADKILASAVAKTQSADPAAV